MKNLAAGIAVLAAIVLCAHAAHARDLTFDERVKAQEAIERVYYSHQIGATEPFEEAVPRARLEKKVRTYLKQSVALEKYWRTPVTAEMLHREMDRMAKGTRMPDRLRELHAALGNDPFLIQECLARSTLVDRLTRNFFAFDEVIHGEERRTTEALHRDLVERRIDPFSEHPRRFVVTLVRAEGRPSDGEGLDVGNPQREADHDPRQVEVGPLDFERWSAKLPDDVGAPGLLVEDREAFVIRVLLERGATELRVATFTVAKRDWEEWWSEVEGTFCESDVRTIASVESALPMVPSGGLLASSCTPEDTWDNGSLDDLPDGRSGHSAVWTGSLLLVWGGGGVVGAPSFNTGGRYDPATDTWTSTSVMDAPTARGFHSAVWTGNRMIVWGGITSEGGTIHHLNTGGQYDPATDRWKRITTVAAPAKRSNHTAVWTGSRMVIWGGRGSSFLGSGGQYDVATDRWTATTTVDAPTKRSNHSAVWTGSEMIVWGGYGTIVGSADPDGGSEGDTSRYVNTGGRYDPAVDRWTPISIIGAPAGRGYHTAVWTGSRMIVWGGSGPDSSAYLDTGGRYDPSTDAWTPTSTLDAPEGRRFHTAVWTGGLMVVWGGTSPSSRTNTGGRYDPATDTWTPTSTVGSPSARPDHTAVWTGSLMLVWGGAGLNTGGRYDPATDTWTPTSTGNAAAGRYKHTAVWTGSAMIVWGGGGEGYLNTGGRYDPATDAWTSTVGAPWGRWQHTAVWTGSVMVVWGGYPDANTGGRYDPASDTWTSTSTTGAPTPRWIHTAVWTGGTMIVWGGFDGHDLGTGGRYNPEADTWQPTSTVGSPTARQAHTAVWTGSEMIVWGGFPGLSNGGRYDPATDTWMVTSLAGVPAGRGYHTAVWTGSRMIVWGGADYDGSFRYLDTGGLYDPELDIWTPTSMVGVPTARWGHTAVWSGTVMVVWGHYFSPTGGRYDPVIDTWAPTSTVGAPSNRRDHTAVWTGSHMIVWGGSVGIPLSSGGRYSPDDDCDLERERH